MKKKLILGLTAFAVFFTTLFSFTACSKDKVNIKKGMKPEKAFDGETIRRVLLDEDFM